MKLSKLLAEIGSGAIPGSDPDVQAITSDHRKVKAGSVFIAVRGTQADGHSFIDHAIEAGAAAVIGEESHPHAKYVRVVDSRLVLGTLSAVLADWPSRSMKVVGVTGTSGKTTTTYLLESIFQAAGKKVGLIGTVSFRIAGKTLPSTHTTPGPVELQALLAQMKAEGCDVVVMEVSSHALKQRRVAGVLFDAVAFTNLSPEHLDYHPDFEDYYQSKKLLFTEQVERSRKRGKDPKICVNTEDTHGARLAQELRIAGEEPLNFFVPAEWTADRSGVRGNILAVGFHSSLAGRFNASNIQCAARVALAVGIPAIAVARGIELLPHVPGRMQSVPNSAGLSIWVDYAHKPDALEKVLQNLQSERKAGKLWTLFGCGGDRDRTKRPVMAEIAERLSDAVVVTSDNPRTEDAQAIIREICQGFQKPNSYRVDPDRRKAITETIHAMKQGDLLLIAGKGHETYQIIGKETFPFDDVQVATEALKTRPR